MNRNVRLLMVLAMAACVPCLALIGCKGGTRAAAVSEVLQLATSDGYHLTATYYAAPRPGAPGLILLPMRGADRHAWDTFAARAQQLGFACVSVDLRGQGESLSGPKGAVSYRTFKTEDWLAVQNDIEAACKALLEHGIPEKDITLAGASIGANLALVYAAAHTEIAAVVMVSPGLDYEGVTTERAASDYGQRPLLLVSSQGDAYAQSSGNTLKQNASGLCEIREYTGAAHGTDLLGASASAFEEILLWLNQIVFTAKQAPATGN